MLETEKNYRIAVLVCGHSRHVYLIHQQLRFARDRTIG